MVPHFTWKNVLCIYFMFIFFFAFYRSGGMNNGPPPAQEPGFHPGDESFAPNMATTRFPVPSIVLNAVFSTMSEIKNQLSAVRSQSIRDIVCDIYACNNDIELITLIC